MCRPADLNEDKFMLIEKIDQDLKVAMKDKNETALMELRTIKAALKNAEIEAGKALTDPDALKVMAKKLKQHKDSIESFTVGNRADLVAMETAQMAVLEKYLPKQMPEAEVAKIVEQTIREMNATTADFGKVMKEVVNKVKGQADGSVISKLVKEYLK